MALQWEHLNLGGDGIKQGERVYMLPLLDITRTIPTPMEIPTTPLTSKRQYIIHTEKGVMGVLGRTLLQSCQAQVCLDQRNRRRSLGHYKKSGE